MTVRSRSAEFEQPAKSGEEPDTTPPCRICGTRTVSAGTRWGRFEQRLFHLCRCPSCRFAFVTDPCRDYERMYSEAYYRGKGADRLVDYVFELERPDETVRKYEWRGVWHVVQSLAGVTTQTRWLDFGCGMGGLVRFLRSKNVEAVGFEESSAAQSATAAGIPMLSECDIAGMSGHFDVVTAIEVLEHVEDPIVTLRLIRRLLKPDGLLFLTTGNAAPYRDRLASWSYVTPEIHISFYEPRTLHAALERCGFRPESRGYVTGFTDVIRFKILKNLGIRVDAPWQNLVPWPVLSRIADWKYRITDQPVGWAAG
jgi:2-polyprenyl-3-methyl-5-hydroxy-6-metoxy-1,4-benzoquinol methylase